MKKIKWGILATGTIAKKFATTLSKLSDAGQLAAVASRDLENAKQFAKEFDIPEAYGSYADLVSQPDIDIIYIATPHSLHYENAKLCLEHSKHVLCEKSFTVNENQAATLFQLAKEKNVFIMEAFWTKFLPAYRLLEDTLSQGTIGELTHFRAQYGFVPTGARYIRKMEPQLAGGALLDIGVYALGVACMLLGYKPSHLHSTAILGEYGTDQFDSMMLSYENGTSAHLITSIGCHLEPAAVLIGTKGQILLPGFTALESFTVMPKGTSPYTLKAPFEVNGFEYQIREAASCLLDHKLESSIMRHQNTLDVLKLMDQARSQWHLKFPGE